MDAAEQRRWQAADSALETLLELPSERRPAALRQLPTDIRPLVERLLLAHSESGPLDETLLSGLMMGGDLSGLNDGVVRTVGPWSLGDELGRGGMAVVYRATRSIASGEQQAALKLLTTAALAGDGRRRFLREHQVLSRLSHPHIAALLDADVLPDGTPYLAMQLVEGERIDQWCEARRLGPREIVSLFLPICDALMYAHRRLVVHRDLKPGNVLVDASGMPRLLDFGIARFTDDAMHGDSTRTGMQALTPQYAAPEQFDGSDSGTAADVFGLGATLYRLLTGTPPRRRQSDVTSPITQPSRATEFLPDAERARFTRALRGDLDAILLKALEPDPRRRYPDASSLADELRRWLEGLPVQAARGNGLYRLRKFARRHVVALSAAVLVVLALGAGLAGTFWQSRLARMEADRATAVKAFVLELFRESAPDRARGEDTPASEMLRRGAERARTEFKQRPALLAEMLQVIGGVQLERGLLEDARVSLDDALALQGRGEPPEVAIRASMDRAMTDYSLGRPSAATQRLEATLARAQALLDSQHALRIQLEVRLADMLVVLERPEEAIEMATAARLRIESSGQPENDPEYPYALRVLGAAWQVAGDSKAAVTLLKAAQEAQYRLDPQGSMHAAIGNDLGIALLSSGEVEAAGAAFANALATQRRLLGDAHPATLATAGNHATARLTLGEVEDASQEFEQLVALMRPTHQDEPHPEFAHALGMAALARYRAGNLREAEHHAGEALAIVGHLSNEDALNVRWIRGVLAALRLEQDDSQPAAALLADTGIDCERYGVNSFLLLRICAGQAVTAMHEGQCSDFGPAPPTSEKAADRLWLAAYWHVRTRCIADPAAQTESAAVADALLAQLPQVPGWLRDLASSISHPAVPD